MRSSQVFWGAGGKGHLFKGAGEENATKDYVFGDREHKKTNFRFGGTCPFISGEQGNRYPLRGPQTCQHQVCYKAKSRKK